MSVRVFHPGPLTAATEIVLSDEESHYLLRVRRATVDENVEVLDGIATRMRARVVGTQPGKARLALLCADTVSLARPLVLAVGIPEKPAMLEVFSRACELGAEAVVMLETDRAARYAPPRDRIDRVIRAAQRQCGRPDSPRIEGPISLSEWLPTFTGTGYIANPGAQSGPLLAASEPLAALVGPEGGFTDKEISMATIAGFTPLPLGPFVLRTEIAVVAAISRIAWDLR